MNKANATTRYRANEANIAAWHRKIRKAASRATQLKREQEHLRLMVAALDTPEVKVVPPPPAPVVTSQGMQLGVAQALVDAGDFIQRGQVREAFIGEPPPGTTPPPAPPPIDWEDPVTAAVMLETRIKAEAAPMVLPPVILPPAPMPQMMSMNQQMKMQRFIDTVVRRPRTR